MQYYIQQSAMSDPGKWKNLFDDFPLDLPSIKEIIQGLILHFWEGGALGYKIPLQRLKEVETRYVHKMLEILMSRDSRSLLFSRTLKNKIVGSCRDFALLFCSILRHRGIPARVRVAFNLYYLKDFYHDQVILEYWNENKQRFCRVDPRITRAYIEKNHIKIDFDLFDAPKEKLMLAGEAWLLTRKNSEIADKFGGGNREKNKGQWYIRDRLIQDLAALNCVETQLWDIWGMMKMPDESLTDPKVLHYFDELATQTLNPEKNFEQLQNKREIWETDFP